MQADRIVIAAPFWDMSFTSALKVFFENMSLFGVTFDIDYEVLGEGGGMLMVTVSGTAVRLG